MSHYDDDEFQARMRRIKAAAQVLEERRLDEIAKKREEEAWQAHARQAERRFDAEEATRQRRDTQVSLRRGHYWGFNELITERDLVDLVDMRAYGRLPSIDRRYDDWSGKLIDDQS